jgi:hypothetical protein
MYLSWLPDDVLEQVYSLLPLSDVDSMFRARKVNPTIQQLLQWAKERELPDCIHLSSLVLFEKNYNLERRIKFCITINDWSSFRRLYTKQYSNKVYPVLDNKTVHPKIVSYILSCEEEMTHNCWYFAVIYKRFKFIKATTTDFLLASTYLSEYNESELLRLSNVIDQKNQEVILEFSLSHEYYSVAKEAIQRGADGRLVTCINDNTPADIIQSFKDYSMVLAEQVAKILIKRKDHDALLVVVQREYFLGNVGVRLAAQIIGVLCRAGLLRRENVYTLLISKCELKCARTVHAEYLYSRFKPKTVSYNPLLDCEIYFTKPLTEKNYDLVRLYLEKGAIGAYVSSVENDIPDDILLRLIPAVHHHGQIQVLNLLVERKHNNRIVSLVKIWGLCPIMNSLKRRELLATLVAEEIVSNEERESLIDYMI